MGWFSLKKWTGSEGLDLGGAAKDIERAVIRPIGGAIEAGLDKVFTVVDGIMSDPKKLVMVGLMIAFPAAAASIGNAILPASLAGSTVSTIVGNTVINTLTNGGNIGEAVKSAVISAGAAGLTDTLKVQFATENISKALTDIAAKTTADVAVATVMGKDPTAALVFGGATAAANVITNNVFEAVGVKDSFDKLPDAAKNALNSALVASFRGQDAGTAAANALVNTALRTFKNGISLQAAAVKSGRDPLNEEEIKIYADDAVRNDPNLEVKIKDPVFAQSYVANIEKASEILGEPVDASFATELAKMSFAIPAQDGISMVPKEISDEDIILAATRAEMGKSNYDFGMSPQQTFNEVYETIRADYLNKQAIDEGWDGGFEEKRYYQNRFSDNFSPEQADLLEEAYANPPEGLDQAQLDKYINSIIGDWRWDKSPEENQKALNDLLGTFELENKAEDSSTDEGGSTVPGEDGENLVIGGNGNVNVTTPQEPVVPSQPEVPATDEPDESQSPFQGPMGPMTEDKIKRYNEEFAKYLDFLQAGEPPPPDYGVQDLGITGEYWDEFNQNLKQMTDEGRLPTQWQLDEEGNYTYVADDGSTLTIGPDGDIVHYTEAPTGNLPGETPAPAPAPAPPPAPKPVTPAPPPKPVTPAPSPAPTPSPAPAPAAQSGLDVNALMALLGMMGGSQAAPAAPQVEYSKMPEFDVMKAFAPTLYERMAEDEPNYLSGLIKKD